MSGKISEIISCKHCSNISQMKIIGNADDIESDRVDTNYEGGYYYDVLKCPACKEVNIRRYYWANYMDGDDEYTYEYLYPNNNNIPLGLPPKILKSLEKANQIKAIYPEYFALELRKILEHVCTDKGAKKGKLAARIKDLAANGVIPDNLVGVAEGLTEIGNIGAHTEIGSLTKKEIPITEALCKAILEYIYTAPYLANEANEKLKSLRAPLKRKS